MADIIIRYAKSGDYEAVEHIMRQVQELHIAWRPDIYKDCEVVLPEAIFLQEIEKECNIVAEWDGAVVGILSFMLRHVESPHQVTRDVLFVDTLAVDEAFRGKGIGHALFDFAKELVVEKGLDGFELQVNARNEKAMEMYKNYGFTEKSINLELFV